MILYDNRNVRAILCRKSGSVIYMRSVQLPALVSTAICVLLLCLPDLKAFLKISDSVARIYASVIGFSIVMRTSMAFGRFFEGVAEVTLMFSKWRDAYCSMIVFLDTSIAEHVNRGNVEITRKLVASKARLLHWFSMLTALSVARLQSNMPQERVDIDVDLNVRDELESVMSEDILATYENNAIEEASSNQVNQETCNGKPIDEDLLKSMSYSKGNDDEGTDSPSSRVGKKRTSSDRIARPVTNHVPLGLPVPSSPTALRMRCDSADDDSNDLSPRGMEATINTESSSFKFGSGIKEDDTRPIVLGRITRQEEHQLLHSVDPAHTVLKWILFEVSRHQISKAQLIPPPVLARVYQELSNGMVGYFMALKIADVPFPFPFAQFLQWALYAFLIFSPLVVLDSIGDEAVELRIHWMSPVINYLACCGYAALNEIATQLEEPFGVDENDYPVHVQQWNMVRSFEDCYFQRRPLDFVIDRFHNDYSGQCMERLIREARSEAEKVVSGAGKPTVKTVPPELSTALTSKFDELRNSLNAFVMLLKRQEQLAAYDDVKGIEQKISEVLSALQAPSHCSEAAAESVSQRQQAMVNNVFKLDDEMYGGSEGHLDDPSGDNFPKAFEDLIDSKYTLAEGPRLRHLLDQHVTSARILKSATSAVGRQLRAGTAFFGRSQTNFERSSTFVSSSGLS